MSKLLKTTYFHLLTKTVLATFCLFLSVTSFTHAGEMPKWITHPPKEKGYLHIVGVKTEAPSLEEGRRLAIQQAIGEIVQYFGFTSQAQFYEKKTELTSKIIDEIQSTSEKVRIKGALLQDWYFKKTEQGKYSVYVLVRYPKREIDKEKTRQRKNETERLFLAQKELNVAMEAEAKGEIISAFAGYIDAMRLSSEIEAGNVFQWKAKDRLKSLSAQVKLMKLSGNNQKGEPLEGLKDPLVIKATLESPKKILPLASLPISFEFIQGGGRLTQETVTNHEGEASCQVTRIEPFFKKLRIQGFIDIERLFPRNLSLSPEDKQTLDLVLNVLRNKKVEFQLISYIPKRNIKVLVSISEKNLGKSIEDSIIGNAISQRLYEAGFQLISMENMSRKQIEGKEEFLKKDEQELLKTRFPGKVQMLITGTVTTRSGSDNLGYIISCLADAHLQLISTENGEIVGKKDILEMRGFGSTKEKAGINALINISTPLAEAIAQQLLAVKVNKYPIFDILSGF